MQSLPDNIAGRLADLKKRYQFYVTVKRINGRYYLYKETGTWDKTEKKAKVISEYLGRITDDGTYIKKRLSAKDDLENAKALISSHGGEIIWRKQPEEGKRLPQKQEINATELELKLLMILSMNARAPMSLISELTGAKTSTLTYKIKRLEQKYGIKYLTEINVGKLGYTAFLGFIKFEMQIPTNEELKRVMEKEPRIQFAATIKGEYDVIFYLLEENSELAVDATWSLIHLSALNKYEARWYVSPISRNYGFIPLREELVIWVKLSGIQMGTACSS